MQKVLPLRIANDADLMATIESFRLIQERVSEIAFEDGTALSAVDMHQLSYAKVKGSLKSQLTCTAIRSVASEYSRARRRNRRIYGPIHFSKPRALFLIGKAKRDACPPRKETIRIWTIAGRKDIPCSIPARFEADYKNVKSFDTLAVSLKRGRLVATVSVTLKESKREGTLPAGVAVGSKNEVAAVSAEGKSLRIVTVAQNVMEETSRKTKRRLERRLAVRKADGLETRSVRRVLKRLSRRRHMRTRTFCHAAANRLVEWVGSGSILVIEDLRIPPPSKRKRSKPSMRPHFYEVLRRRIEEKAAAAAIPVYYVNVSGNEKRCSLCGASGSITKHTFLCDSCGNESPMSKNAALNVRNKFTVTRPWAAVNRP
jgi:putative transposase